jgi:hypothetical protein
MSGPTPTGEIVRPRNPYIGFAFAAAWALVAVSGIIVLLIDGERVVTGQISGQRSVGLFLITPAIGVVLGIIALVRASVAVRPWGAYLAATTPEQRQALSDSHFSKRSFTPLLVAGLAVAAGWLVILAFVIAGIETASTAGLSALVMVLTLLGMAGATLISVGMRGNAAFRRSQGR